MGKIHKLSQNLINLIAAGEVVERPASALKELLENSIDAKSDLIIVKLEEFGLKSISVKDNGVGMDRSDALMAFEQHATSKLNSEEELNQISTMGFRGEALASISSVAEEIEILTKQKNSEAVHLSIRQTIHSDLPAIQSDNGTIINVKSIFENIPARKKFLKTPQTELRYLVDTFINIALPYLNIHFELYHNNKLIHKLTKTDNLKNRVYEIWGKTAKGLFEESFFDSSDIKIKGIFGNSDSGRKSSPIQYTYINNRYVINKTISSAINEGYNGFINRELKPTYFIFLEINPDLVDINVHPRKLEVRFSKPDEVFRSTLALTRKTLEKNTRSIIQNSLTEVPQTPSIMNIKNHSNHFQKSAYSPSSNIRIDISKPKIEEALNFNSEFAKSRFDQTESFVNQSYKPYQVFNTYIVIEKDDRLIFIDQHAAAEKITFEKLINNLGKLPQKPLLFPEIIELNDNHKRLVLEKREDLQKIGFSIEDMGPGAIQITDVPEMLSKFDIHEYISKIIDPDDDIENNFNQFETYNGVHLTKDIYLLLATTACHSSIRAGQKLSEIEMNNITSQLTTLTNPYNCPHGRPVLWELSKYEIEKNFRRKI